MFTIIVIVVGRHSMPLSRGTCQQSISSLNRLVYLAGDNIVEQVVLFNGVVMPF